MVPNEDRSDGGARRMMFYGHDSVGLGHFNRMLAICEGIRRVDPTSTILLATGTPFVPLFDIPEGADYIKLPSLAKPSRDVYCGKYLRTSLDRVISCREALLLSAVQSFEPKLLLVDKSPTGVCGELMPALRWLKNHRPEVRIIFGMRDVEDDPRSTIEQWGDRGAFDVLARYYDEVWVYGMRGVFDVISEYSMASAIDHKLRYMGYVVRQPCEHQVAEGSDHRRVLVTVGGGTDGTHLLETYLERAAHVSASRGVQSTLIGGPDLPAAAAKRLRLQADGMKHVRWIDHVRCMSCQIQQADVVVSMGGYNTLCEVVSRHKRALVVPRTAPRREQFIRASRWAGKRALQYITPDELTSASLATQLESVLDDDSIPGQNSLDFGGLDRVRTIETHLPAGET